MLMPQQTISRRAYSCFWHRKPKDRLNSWTAY